MSTPAKAKEPAKVKNDKVKVRILKHVGSFTPGQEVEVTEAEASYLCMPKCRNDGANLVRWQNAMLLEEFEAMKAAPVDVGGLTQDELRALGVRNVVQTPPDDILPARLKVQKPNQPAFEDAKDPTEGASALESLELNAKNPATKKESA